MLFQTFTFLLLFLPVAFVGYELLSRLKNPQILFLWIFLCSIVFYGWNEPQFIWLLTGSIVFNYLAGLALKHGKRNRKGILVCGIAANLLILGYFKYAGFFLDTISRITGSGYRFEEVVLPLAISFFTFQQIVFLVQMYRRNLEDVSPLQYASYIAFFPQLIAGPIVQPQDLLPQLKNLPQKEARSRRLSIGITYFALGLFKKVCLADTLEPYASKVFLLAESGAAVPMMLAWGGALAFTFQIYFDFSAYSEMAIGLARMFGLRLPVNFDAPYRSRSITEFWRRWHITLSAFLKEYLYFPLGGSRFGTILTLRNLMVTMLLSGLWHGAGWTFVFWGGLHGVWMCGERVSKEWVKSSSVHNLRSGKPWLSAAEYLLLWNVASWLITFLFLVFSWVFFRAETFAGAMSLLQGMVGLHGILPPAEFPGAAALWDAWWIEAGDMRSFNFGPWILLAPLGALLYIHLLPTVDEFMRGADDSQDPLHHTETTSLLGRMLQWSPRVLYGIGIALLIIVAIRTMLLSSPAPFIYFKF